MPILNFKRIFRLCGINFRALHFKTASRKKYFDKNQYTNIAGRLPEISRNSFVDLQSQKKTLKKTDLKKIVCSLKADVIF